MVCVRCGSVYANLKAKHKSMPFRYHTCDKRFSVRTRPVMEYPGLGYQAWVIAFNFMGTDLEGVPSMKLHKDL